MKKGGFTERISKLSPKLKHFEGSYGEMDTFCAQMHKAITNKLLKVRENN